MCPVGVHAHDFTVLMGALPVSHSMNIIAVCFTCQAIEGLTSAAVTAVKEGAELIVLTDMQNTDR